MNTVFHVMLKQLRQNQPIALATVVGRKGSLPMSTRAKMAILPDGSIAGTIGGGALEATVIRTARQRLASPTPATAELLSFELTSDQIESDGLTCGGSVEVFLEYCRPATALPVVEALITLDEQAQAAAAMVVLPGAEKSDRSESSLGQRIVVHENGALTGSTGEPGIDAALRRFARPYIGQDVVGVYDVPCQDGSMVRVFLETIVPPPTVYLFGGGHISYQVARLLPMLGFDFVVVDDREAFANPQRFPDAKACVVHDFSDIASILTTDMRWAYLIMVTRGHQSDFQVLQQALRLQPAYIGMIGSRRKIRMFFEELRQHGISQERLDAVHAPIGLEIGADTPEEIAVSIAAELIHMRRKKIGVGV